VHIGIDLNLVLLRRTLVALGSTRHDTTDIARQQVRLVDRGLGGVDEESGLVIWTMVLRGIMILLVNGFILGIIVSKLMDIGLDKVIGTHLMEIDTASTSSRVRLRKAENNSLILII
jgi:hypothetical protein